MTLPLISSSTSPLASIEQRQIYQKALNFPTVKIGDLFSDMFKGNKTLLHLDLSHNNLTKDDCSAIQEGLQENHTLLGLHMVGNEVNTDAQGFVKDENQDPWVSHIISRLKPTLVSGTVSRRKVELNATSNCWICEGWSQMLFKWNPFKEASPEYLEQLNPQTVVYIHLSCDNFHPELMEKDDKTGEFSLLRMVPPGPIEFYFSIAQPPILSAKSAMTSFTKSFLNQKRIEVPGTNIIENLIQTKTIINQTFIEDLTILPRPPPKKIKLLKREKTPWDFKKSVFKDYVPDNEEILAKCFETDWTNSKIMKVVKDQEQQS